MSTVGSKNYNGQDWFWPHDYRHYLRDANPKQRKLVHNGWLKIGVPVKKSGLKISDRYLEPKKSQEKKAWTIVKKVIAPKELESVNEELNSSAYSQLSRSIKAIAINIKDLAKAHKKQDDGVVRNEIDNLLYDVKRMVNIIGNKKYNESVNEGMTKYNIRLTKTPGWYGIWDKNGKQKAEGEKKYIIKFLKSLKTRMGNFQIKSLVDLAADRKGTNIAFDVAESVNEGFADKLTKKMKKHKGTSVKSKKKVKLKGRGVYQQYESDLPITTKKGKTVRAVHKKSGKEIVSVDNPSTRKILKKMGFVVKESVNESVKVRNGEAPMEGKWAVCDISTGKAIKEVGNVRAATRLMNRLMNSGQYKEVAAKWVGEAKSKTIKTIGSIIGKKQAQKIDGVLVDMQTANVIMKVWNALNPSNRKKFEKLSIKKMANVAWKLVK